MPVVWNRMSFGENQRQESVRAVNQYSNELVCKVFCFICYEAKLSTHSRRHPRIVCFHQWQWALCQYQWRLSLHLTTCLHLRRFPLFPRPFLPLNSQVVILDAVKLRVVLISLLHSFQSNITPRVRYARQSMRWHKHQRQNCRPQLIILRPTKWTTVAAVAESVATNVLEMILESCRL